MPGRGHATAESHRVMIKVRISLTPMHIIYPPPIIFRVMIKVRISIKTRVRIRVRISARVRVRVRVREGYGHGWGKLLAVNLPSET